MKFLHVILFTLINVVISFLVVSVLSHEISLSRSDLESVDKFLNLRIDYLSHQLRDIEKTIAPEKTIAELLKGE
jgi:hypothetical protein